MSNFEKALVFTTLLAGPGCGETEVQESTAKSSETVIECQADMQNAVNEIVAGWEAGCRDEARKLCVNQGDDFSVCQQLTDDFAAKIDREQSAFEDALPQGCVVDWRVAACDVLGGMLSESAGAITPGLFTASYSMSSTGETPKAVVRCE